MQKNLYYGRKIIIDANTNNVFPIKRKYPEDEDEYEGDLIKWSH